MNNRSLSAERRRKTVLSVVLGIICIIYVLPVLVGILFTLLHALIQAYVLTMLTALFYGEVSQRSEPASGKKQRAV